MAYDKLSYDDKLDLSYLIHDKQAVLPEYGGKLEGLESALGKYSESAPQIYRGLYEEEVNEIGDLKKGKKFSFKGYTSFSERLKIGLTFGEGTRFVLSVKNGYGFCYWKYNYTEFSELKKEDPQEFEDVDGEHMIESANKEREWILPRNAKFEIVDFKTDHGYTVVQVNQIK